MLIAFIITSCEFIFPCKDQEITIPSWCELVARTSDIKLASKYIFSTETIIQNIRKNIIFVGEKITNK